MRKPAFEEAVKDLAARKRRKLVEHPSPDELLAYHLGEPQPEKIERVQDHLAVCGQCTQFILSLGPVPESSAMEGSSEITAGQVSEAWGEFRARLDSAEKAEQAPDWTDSSALPSFPLRPKLAYLAAAVLLVATVGLALKVAALSQLEPNQLDGAAQLFSVSNATRGGDDPGHVVAASAKNPLLILIASEAIPPYPLYSAEIVDESGEPVGFIDRLLRLEGLFLVQPGQLKPGRYRVHVLGIRGQSRDRFAEFEFLVR